MKLAVYYDYFEGLLSPLWFVANFRKGELDWHKETAYIPVSAPFQRQGTEEFISDKMGISVTLGDLTIHHEKPGMFGILLDPLRRRAMENLSDYWNAEYLIVQVSDLEEILQMNPWR